MPRQSINHYHPGGGKVFSFKEMDILYEEENVGGGHLTLIGGKRVMSEEHKVAFT